MTYTDPTTGEYIGEFEIRDEAGEVTRRTEWFATQAEAAKFSKTGVIERKDTVAATIKDQIGFWALAEVSARGFMFDAKSLYFDAKPKSRIVRVVVTLDPSDTYTVRMVNKKTGADIYRTEGVYNDMLAEVIRTLAERA